MVLRVAGCAGHAGFGVTLGKRTPAGEYEWNFNNKVILAFEEALKQYEDVIFLRTDDRTGRKDVSLDDRVDKANRWGADLYISFHHNAYLGRWGTWTGTETFTFKGSWPAAERLAGYVHSRLVEAYGLKDRGLKKADFQILRESNMPAVLLEGGYMDSIIDIKKLRDDKVLRAAGYAVAAGVAKYAGLKKKFTAKPPTKPAQKPKPVPKPKEENEMLPKAIVINGFADFPVAERLALKLKAPVYLRSIVKGQKVAKELYVVGGTKDDMVADEVTLLSGADRFETAAAVAKYLN
ncbi:N-acetylmuramoyl-L-alanine amidase [Bacillus sp. CMF12]|uniref:N-acetylmuramoyl-L-alanine amidase family protein n=1 Tax=Bacillus sp. CMF12 TaxID=2884834 RepID=UPI00207A08A6|nr:N-acetylmuramoyl-L-alanine amidase [Bacillus sp. CMF12]USK48855.1 N-acetylmuramoyl-L-alanine amidase [Bacillus sp. CMF12]